MGNGQRLAADELQVKINRNLFFFSKKREKKGQLEPIAQAGAGSEQLGFQITRL